MNKSLKSDFPILQKKIRNNSITYLDTASTSQKPSVVIESITNFYHNSYENVHRGMNSLSIDATEIFEASREKIKNFINAQSSNEIIFTKNATEGTNIIAHALSSLLNDGDEIITTELEHHSNFLPWMSLSKNKKLKFKVIPILPNGTIKEEDVINAISSSTKLVAISHMSNVTGQMIDIKKIKTSAVNKDLLFFIDGCQSIAHRKVDVQELDCDFYVFSGHKIYGPTGVGVLYGKFDILDSMPPWRGGGEMIREVKKDSITFADLPSRFEAGTPNIAQAIGLGFAIDYFISKIDDGLFSYEKEIAKYFHNEVQGIKKIKVYGEKNIYSPLISFTVDGAHPHDIATLIDREGVAIRAGHHCCQPLLKFLNVNSTARASIGMYTDKNDIDIFIKALDKAITFFD